MITPCSRLRPLVGYTKPLMDLDQKAIQGLRDEGRLTEVDIHFARLMSKFSEKADGALFLAAALASRATSEGHVCLDLSTVAGQALVPDPLGEEALFCPPVNEWIKRLLPSEVVGRPGEFKPLILDEENRLYLYRYWDYERSLAQGIKARAYSPLEDLDGPLLARGLSRLFPGSEGKKTDWQKVAACVSVLNRFAVISGGPGTGKSTLIAKILALVLEQEKGKPLSIALAAPTGKAAARLQEAVKQGREGLSTQTTLWEAIPIEASTLHRLLGALPGSPYFRHHREHPLSADMAVVDEASMVDLALLTKLIQALPGHSRLILLGDKDQLASVQAGSVLGDICDTGRSHGFSASLVKRIQAITGCVPPVADGRPGVEPGIQDCVVELRESFRFGGRSGIGAAAAAINQGQGTLALEIMEKERYNDIVLRPLPVRGALFKALRKAVLEGYKTYLETTDPIAAFRLFDQFRILCALRRGPYGAAALNDLVERILREAHLIGGGGKWYRGRPLLITRNDYNLGLFNGDIGLVLPDAGPAPDLCAHFLSADGTVRKFSPVRLPEHETAFALTVHKSQGSEFEKALLLLPDRDSPVVTRELIYTGITRVRKGIEVWGPQQVFLEGVRRRTRRTSGLRDALWNPGRDFN